VSHCFQSVTDKEQSVTDRSWCVTDRFSSVIDRSQSVTDKEPSVTDCSQCVTDRFAGVLNGCECWLKVERCLISPFRRLFQELDKLEHGGGQHPGLP